MYEWVIQKDFGRIITLSSSLQETEDTTVELAVVAYSQSPRMSPEQQDPHQRVGEGTASSKLGKGWIESWACAFECDLVAQQHHIHS